MWALAALVLLGTLLALLFVPADVSLKVERDKTLTAALGLHWLFVRVQRPLRTGEPRKKTRKQRPHRRGSSVPLRSLAEVAAVPGIWDSIRRFLARMARSVRVLEVGGNVRLATGDPADTGCLWALVWPAAVWSNRWRQVDLSVEPDFSGAGPTGTLGGTVRFYPARFVYGIVRTLFSMTTIRLVMAVLRSRSWRQ